MQVVRDKNLIFIKQKNRNIKPKRIIEDNVVYDISETPNDYIINEYCIVLEENEFASGIQNLKDLIILNSWHPNASDDPDCEEDAVELDYPPEEQIFCLPEDLINKGFSKDTYQNLINELEYLLETWNYKNSYWKKWLGIQYRESFNLNMIEEKPTKISTKDVLKGLTYPETRPIALELIKLKTDLEICYYAEYRNKPNPSTLQKIALVLSAIDKGKDHISNYIIWRNDGKRR